MLLSYQDFNYVIIFIFGERARPKSIQYLLKIHLTVECDQIPNSNACYRLVDDVIQPNSRRTQN